MNELYAEYLGIITGDGCLSYSFPKSQSGPKYYTYVCGHSKDDLDYLHFIKNLIKTLFNKEVCIKFRSKENCAYIKFSNKSIFLEVSKFIPIGKKYDLIKIPCEILDNDSFFKSFIRGYFDTDGSVVVIRGYPRLEIKSKSGALLDSVLQRLRLMGFYGSVSKSSNYSRLELPGHNNLKKWLKFIGFKNKKHLNRLSSLKV